MNDIDRVNRIFGRVMVITVILIIVLICWGHHDRVAPIRCWKVWVPRTDTPWGAYSLHGQRGAFATDHVIDFKSREEMEQFVEKWNLRGKMCR